MQNTTNSVALNIQLNICNNKNIKELQTLGKKLVQFYINTFKLNVRNFINYNYFIKLFKH